MMNCSLLVIFLTESFFLAGLNCLSLIIALIDAEIPLRCGCGSGPGVGCTGDGLAGFGLLTPDT